MCTTTKKCQRELRHNLLLNNKLWQRNENGGGGIRTPLDTPDTLLQNGNKSAIEMAQSLVDINTYEDPQNPDFKQKLTVPERSSDTFLDTLPLAKEKNLDDSLQTTIEQNETVCQVK